MRAKAYYELGTLSALNAKTTMVLAQDFRHIELNVLASSVVTGFTLKVYKSDQLTPPDISSAVSATNKYSTVQVINKATGATVDGATGIVVNANGMQTFEVNDNVARWVGVMMTARTDGTANIDISLVNDN